MKKTLLGFIMAGFFTCAYAQADSLQEYTGKYTFPDGSVVPEVEVILTDSVLSMVSVAGESILVPDVKDRFLIISFDGWAVFGRNESGKITAVHIEAGGYVLDGKKEENTDGVFVPSGLKEINKPD